jgi:hypothetical protein
VPTSDRFEYAEFVNPEEFLSEADDTRAIGASFKRIEYTSKKTNEKVLNKGLTIRTDMDAVKNMPNWRQIYTGRLLRRLYRSELRRSITLISAAATNDAKTWNGTAGQDPDQDVRTSIEAAADSSGVYPNRVLYGASAWNARVRTHRALLTAGSIGSVPLNLAELADMLNVDEVRVSRERYQSSASAKTQIVNLLVLIYLAEANQTPEDPSNVKRFVTPTAGGTPVRVYEQIINSKLTDITVEHYSNIKITSTLGVRKITVTA